MSLQGIFDPVVRAYYKKKFGGGNAVDDGYCITWDGNTEGRDYIEAEGVPAFFKVSSLIIDAERLEGCTICNESDEIEEWTPNILALNGVTALTDSTQPYVFSGKAGTYSYSGITATLPSDGTYFMGVFYNIRKLYKGTSL